MPDVVKFGKRERLSFAKSPEIMNLPDLIEIQKSSYHEFLQVNIDDDKRKDEGLHAVFNEIFPIHDFSETSSLEFVSYSLGDPKYDINECQYRGFTYGVPLKIRVQLILRELDKDTGDKQVIDIKESDVYMGEIPLMTEKGTFFINGAERVIVSQLHRSPSATFNEEYHTSGHKLFVAKIVPYRGAWIEFEYDIKDQIYVRLDRRKKMLVTILLRALGWETDEQILKLFAKGELVSLTSEVVLEEPKEAILTDSNTSSAKLEGAILVDSVVNPSTEDVLLEANTVLTKAHLSLLRQANIRELRVLYPDDLEALKTLEGSILGASVINPNTGEELIGADAELTETILREFLQAGVNIIKVWDIEHLRTFVGRVLAAPVIDSNTGEVLLEANTDLAEDELATLQEAGVETIEILDEDDARRILFLRNSLQRDVQSDYKEGHIQDQALVEIFRRIQPGDPPTLESARSRFEKLIFDPARYDLSRVGRYKLNEKLGALPIYRNGTPDEPSGSNGLPDESVRTLRREDIAATLDYLMRVQHNNGEMDDIDHLGNRRVRAIGELLQNQIRTGLIRVVRATRERMTAQELESATPPDLINPKPLTGAIKDFFGSSQLSQFMQQTNPIDELTHKRRLSALGPGGLHRERATFEVRDVHRTHYGRVCPIETPEGPSVGLIVSLSTYARVNEYGFLETPYRKVKDGVATGEVTHMTADKEDAFVIAQANTKLDGKGKIIEDQVSTRFKGDFPRMAPKEVDYLDVSSKQIVGVSASLIPFLEHDDANRALMGANQQRQAVPLVRPQAPMVGTGMEFRAARDSGAVVLAKRDGIVESVSAAEIIVRTDDAFRVDGGEQSFSEMGYDVYHLTNFKRSNNGTCIHQIPCVAVGEHVEAEQVIADGTATDDGELALGNNVLVAFMPWEGYNFEDALLISESLVSDDTFTSIHIDEFDVEARDTKMGREEITRDIPNLSEEALNQLDEEGIIRVGSIVRPGSILVGKVTPKGESDLGPEEKLLRAIFGEKVGEVRDASTYAKPGVEGVVIDVKVFSRKERENDRQTELREIAKEKTIEKTWQEKCTLINRRRDEEIRHAVLGKRLAQPASNGDHQLGEEGEIVTETLLKHDIALESIVVDDADAMERIERVQQLADGRIQECTVEKDADLEKIRKGDELKPGVIKLVKVYVANRRKISVGDKMAGRHGNKGVVAKILPQEDMPYLEDGSPVGIVLNPLGVPSRMNVGQILETHLGWAAKSLGLHIATPVFDGATESEISELLNRANLPGSGKATLYDGRTGAPFAQKATVGYTYILKLNHLVDDKIHARSTGPYSLVTQQPLGGKAQQGGQRFGEMEVWALEAYGAAYTLQELLTIKSDDVAGRSKIYESIVKGENAPSPGTPESFNVLVKELQSLGLDVGLEQRDAQSDDIDNTPAMPWLEES
ncbi:MAG: DNA-directed RNA polymerase subunit beta [Candidatus Poribacteria bacterium]|nr:DNA-directed RNA polymerase subunit beta [Candidatus Poribacteria bacterium]MDE0506565.1 DNA-directed RNA polymerase subunit beta [Candidatus Poribacteria bacterium]